MFMNPFRCQVCGESYLGNTAPDRCPFCGAAGHHMAVAGEWVPITPVEMSEESRQTCLKALDLELSNQAFYKCAAKNSNNQITEAIFKRLSKQEGEHAEIFCKLLGIEVPTPQPESCHDKDSDNFADAHEREKRAINYYLESANKVKEKRVQDVFRALAEIESEHLKISNIYR